MKPTRTHKSCWTCKSRRRKCDRGHPTCLSCSQRGIVCEGYGVRLRWGSGIASRGIFAGLDVPVKEIDVGGIEFGDGRAGVGVREWRRGRKRDLERERDRAARAQQQQQQEKMETVASGSNTTEVETDCESRRVSLGSDASLDERLFDEFCCSGINILCGKANDPDCIFRNSLPTLCRQSEALYRICLALQVSVSPCRSDQFFEYFDTALKHFRSELNRTGTAQLADGTFTAGLLLCTIGMIRGAPWTMHLQGLYNVLLTNGLTSLRWQPTPVRAHLLEVLGIMDLSMLTIGRQRPAFGVWKQYCRERVDPDGIEVVSGLPKTMLDLFSCIDEGTVAEEDFWNWPGARGSLVECQLWEAYRAAGILTIRYPGLLLASWAQPQRCINQQPSGIHLPSTAILVSRILSNIDAICRFSAGEEGQKSLVLNATQYPVLVAGLQTEIVNGDSELKRVITTCLSINTRRIESNRCLLGMIEEWWRLDGTGEVASSSIHNIAESRGVELGLF
ncbi:hypothetical protein BJX68DRAFT_89034 [Aspergillus pseudodeflectus]|uniref:Zn(2)-C6 fungal-type domain-containing protein n=1 Tax=Aspergillus pseudodeflectus TaxID=176178 RepID=A0ABR4L8Y0_9EURO